jgi:HK97 gp10 family phage protein
MSSITVQVTVTANRARSLASLMNKAVEKSNQKVLQRVADRARELAVRDTGAMAESVYVATPEFSDYGQRVATGQALRPEAHFEPEERPTEPLSGVVGAPADYSSLVEFGTERTPPRPFLAPAADEIQKTYLEVTVPALNEVLEYGE